MTKKQRLGLALLLVAIMWEILLTQTDPPLGGLVLVFTIYAGLYFFVWSKPES